MSGFDLCQFQRLTALLTRIRAAGSEPAARLGVDRRSNFTFQQDAFLLVMNIHSKNSRQQRLGIRVKRILKQFIRRTGFNHRPQIHNADVIRNMADDRQIMRDKHVSQLILILQIHQQIQNLCLNGNIKRRNRLVTDNKFRVQRNRTRNTDTLTATAIQLMGVRVTEPFFHTHKIKQPIDLMTW